MTTRTPDFLHGVIPVLLTPFTAGGEADEDGMTAVAGHVMGTGVPAVMYPGYASEFYRLTDRERSLLLDLVLAAGAERGTPVVASVTEESTFAAAAQAQRSAEAGAAAVNILPVRAFPGGPGDVAKHVSTVLTAVDPLPAVVQLAPGLTGAALGVDDLVTLAEKHRNLVAVKVETSPAGPAVTALRSLAPELGSLVGLGGLHLLDGLERGACAVQPGCSFVEVYQHLWALWESGARADAAALHARLLPYLTYWTQDIGLLVHVEKIIAARRGWISGSHCRTPSRVLDPHEDAMVERFLTEVSALSSAVTPV